MNFLFQCLNTRFIDYALLFSCYSFHFPQAMYIAGTIKGNQEFVDYSC